MHGHAPFLGVCVRGPKERGDLRATRDMVTSLSDRNNRGIVPRDLLVPSGNYYILALAPGLPPLTPRALTISLIKLAASVHISGR